MCNCREEGDYRPVMLQNFQCGVYEMNLSFDQFRQDAKLAAESYIRNAEKYDLDGIIIDFDTAMSAGACGCGVYFHHDKPAVCIKGILDDIEEVDSLKRPIFENDPRVMHCIEVSRLIADYFKNEKYVECGCDPAPFSLASMLRGSQELMVDLMDEDNEEYIYRLLDYSRDATEQFVKLGVQTGAHCIANGDSVAGPAMISPQLYRKYAKPYEVFAARIAHEHGKDYKLHICGDTSLILNDFLDLPVVLWN